jgi:HEAT repeat protein
MGIRSTPSRAPRGNNFVPHVNPMSAYKNTHTGRCVLVMGICRLAAFLLVLVACGAGVSLCAQQGASRPTSSYLTPRQREIEKQSRRLQSTDEEERRDAVMNLGWIRHPDGSRAAVAALSDPVPIIRGTAAIAVLSLPAEEAVAVLVPLLNDKKEFVRQQVAYALGETRSSSAVEQLVVALVRDEQSSVRGAAAVALGMIADNTASVPLARIVAPEFRLPGVVNPDSKQKKEQNEFVQRAAARALGQMRSRASVPALIAAIGNKRLTSDVRREIVYALGLIGDLSAVPVLRETLTAADPYLARYAYDALLRISPAEVSARP